MINVAENMYETMVSPEVVKAIKITFDVDSQLLPSRTKILSDLEDPFDSDNYKSVLQMNPLQFMSAFAVRELYLKNAFVAYNHEMLVALKRFCDKKKMKTVHEVCCGTGWFSHWMRKYGIPLVKAVDDKSWGSYKKLNNFLPIVTKEDAVRFVKRSGDADMIVCSWPYMNPLMHMIWNAMKPGQYLLYIGEDYGGCTADDGFFNAVSGHEIEDDKDFIKIKKSFIQFSGLHDRPVLYKK